MTDVIDKVQSKAARVAGASYFMIIANFILSMTFGPFNLMVKGDMTATFQNMLNNQLPFRGGVL